MLARSARFFSSELPNLTKATALASAGFTCLFLGFGVEAFKPQSNDLLPISLKLAGVMCLGKSLHYFNQIANRANEAISHEINSIALRN